MSGNVSSSSEAVGAQLLGLWDGSVTSTDAIYPFMLLSLRVATVLAMTPLLYAMPVPARVKVLLVLALSIALAGNLGAVSVGHGYGNLLEAAMREVALGSTLALGIMLAFAAFSVAGQMLDTQIGFGIAQVYDPMSGRSSPLLVSAFNTLAVLVFFFGEWASRLAARLGL